MFARGDWRYPVFVGFDVFGPERKSRGDFDDAIRRAVRLSRDADACRFEPASRPGDHHPAGNIGTVFAGSIFDGGEFFTSYCLKYHGFRSQRQGVEYERFDFYTVRLCRSYSAAACVDVLDFLNGAVDWQGKTASIELLDKHSAYDMNSDGAELKDQRAVRFSLVGLFIGQVDVLYYGNFAVNEAEIADLFSWIGFDKCLGRHFGSIECVQADKERVEDIHKRVVNLPITNIFDAPAFHIVQGAAVVEGL